MSDSIFERHPTDFFRELVTKALHAQAVEAGEETEFYLVHLLEKHLRASRDLLDRPLGVSYLEAEAGEPERRFERFRQVGDTALFLSGIFTDSLERTLVQPSYYVALGRLAYHRTAESVRRPLRELFEHLAARFSDLVRVLGEISASDMFASDRDTLRIYRRWLLTGGNADAALLVKRGLIPAAPARLRQ